MSLGTYVPDCSRLDVDHGGSTSSTSSASNLVETLHERTLRTMFNWSGHEEPIEKADHGATLVTVGPAPNGCTES